MKKKEYLLRNRIINGVLFAVLIQSLFFGLVLLSLRGFAVLSRQPYETMQARLKDKNDVISSTLNQIYLEGAGLKRQIKRSTSTGDTHTMLIDMLNKADYLSAVMYMHTDSNDGVYYVDSEPQEYSIDASDISCLVGTSQAGVKVSMSNKWEKSYKAEKYAAAKELAQQKEDAEGWFYDPQADAFYYVLYVESGNDSRIVFLEAKTQYLNQMFADTTGSMQFWLGNEKGEFYAGTDSLMPVSVVEKLSDGVEEIVWNNEGEEYTGYRERVKTYGTFKDGQSLYVEVLGRTKELQAPVWEMIWKIIIAYAFSLAVCMLACWGVTALILKPLKQMLQDIKNQKGRTIRFKEGQAAEIQSIYNALNDMTKRLEESYSRYNLMEEVEQNLGSFLYHRDTQMTDISRSVEELLRIPPQYLTADREMSVENWKKLLDKLTAFQELNAYTFTGEDGNVYCVSFKTKDEENGVFGVVMDKTAEYRKISKLRFASEHDFLTKLNNASYMKEQGEVLLKKHKGRVNAMMFCDLDNLKYVNDHYGHSMGDAYIVAMADKMQWSAEQLRKEKPSVDVITARISGDEFAMLFTGFDTREEIRDILVRLYKRKGFISISDEEEYSVRVSVGFAYESKTADTVDKLLRCADMAMYSIKSRNKNGIAVYVDETHSEEVDVRTAGSDAAE